MVSERLENVDKSAAKKQVAKKEPKQRRRFTREVIAEMKKVTWLSKKDWLKSTLVVLVVVIAIAAVVGAFDYLFSLIVTWMTIG